jgi:DNA polymerase-1
VYPAPPPITEVANYPIQRTAGEMMNLEIIQLDRLLKERVPSAKLIVQLHDAFDVECDEDDADKVVAIYNEVCDREYTIEGRTRRFPVEIKIGKDWSEL